MRAHLSLFSGVIFVAAGLACDSRPSPDPPTPDPTELVIGRAEAAGVCGHHTETQASWGAPCDDDGGPGCFRDEFFATVFPEGLYVGCGEFTVNLLSSAAVEVALPTVGKPRALHLTEAGAYDSVNDPKPGTALFGQVVALTLNTGFGGLPGFNELGPQDSFGELVVADENSPCAGMTVQQVLDEANLTLGGCAAVLSPTDVYGCVYTLNKAFAEHASCSDHVAIADEPM